MLVVLGVITLASAGNVGAGSSSWLLRVVGIALSRVLNFVLFMLAFRILTTEDLSWADVSRALSSRRSWWKILQAVGGYYVSPAVIARCRSTTVSRRL